MLRRKLRSGSFRQSPNFGDHKTNARVERSIVGRFSFLPSYSRISNENRVELEYLLSSGETRARRVSGPFSRPPTSFRSRSLWFSVLEANGLTERLRTGSLTFLTQMGTTFRKKAANSVRKFRCSCEEFLGLSAQNKSDQANPIIER